MNANNGIGHLYWASMGFGLSFWERSSSIVIGTGSIWAFAFFLYCLSSALCSSTWRKEARLIEPRPMVGLNVLELQTAKEILAEVFHARPDLGFDFRYQHES